MDRAILGQSSNPGLMPTSAVEVEQHAFTQTLKNAGVENAETRSHELFQALSAGRRFSQVTAHLAQTVRPATEFYSHHLLGDERKPLRELFLQRVSSGAEHPESVEIALEELPNTNLEQRVAVLSSLSEREFPETSYGFVADLVKAGTSLEQAQVEERELSFALKEGRHYGADWAHLENSVEPAMKLYSEKLTGDKKAPVRQLLVDLVGEGRTLESLPMLLEEHPRSLADRAGLCRALEGEPVAVRACLDLTSQGMSSNLALQQAREFGRQLNSQTHRKGHSYPTRYQWLNPSERQLVVMSSMEKGYPVDQVVDSMKELYFQMRTLRPGRFTLDDFRGAIPHSQPGSKFLPVLTSAVKVLNAGDTADTGGIDIEISGEEVVIGDFVLGRE